jgi:hypothetical protein
MKAVMKAVMIAENRAARDCGGNVGTLSVDTERKNGPFAVSEKRGWHV